MEGVCGLCVTRVLEGEPDHRDDVLSDDERHCGRLMTVCVSRVRGGLLVLDL
jgi:ferredoxin